ncbi:MAG: hypothetical protein K6U88_07455 [Dehalococcoidia bacterium]|nr:hypothetical protein [Dehalococcoidia bacterium]
MPGSVRWAGWLIVCTLVALAASGLRAESPGPGIPASLPSPAAAPPRDPPPAGAAGGDGDLPPEARELALAAVPALNPAVILAAQPAFWPSACLGLPSPGAACAQAVVAGWIITLAGPDGRTAVVHVGAGTARIAESP